MARHKQKGRKSGLFLFSLLPDCRLWLSPLILG
jgi:hypothetical protein